MAKTQTSTSNNNSQSTVEIPAEIRKRGTQITNAAMGTYMDPGKPYQPYRASEYAAQGQNRTGQLNQYHDMAGQNFQNAGSSYQPYINRADQAATQGAAGTDAERLNSPNYNYANIQQFMNPYEQGVIDGGVRDIGEALNTQRLENQSRAGLAGAFGGARHGVIDAESQATAAQTLSDFVGDQRYQGFQQAVNQFNTNYGQEAQKTQINNAANQQDWQKAQSLSQIYANLGKQTQDQQIAAGNSQLQLGNIMTAQDQAERDAAYQAFLDKRDYPMSIYERLAALNAAQPYNRTSTTTGTSTQETPVDWIGPPIGAAGTVLAASDERTKEDIEERDPEEVLGAFSQIKPYTYKYTDEARDSLGDLTAPGQRRGFMAQDIEKALGRPSGPEVGGYKTVDLGNLVGDLVAAVHGLEKRTRKLKAGA